jgi:CheY-like chemotaxis protein
MKFTGTGSITLRLEAWSEEPGGHAVLITVEDTGPGMTEDQLARLFTPFDQTLSGVSALHGGTGLGLAISRQLAELMGGRLTVRSSPGTGTSFTLSLFLLQAQRAEAAPATLDRESRDAVARALPGQMPSPTVRNPSDHSPAMETTSSPARVEPVAHQDPQPVTDDSEADEGRPMRVLVVDDHDINRRALQLILQPLGCDIATAADGLTAVRICEQTAFDLIFMDVRMPEMDGREATRRIRAGGGPNAGVPIIAVTADTAPDDIAACTEAGMTYFVSKPITPPMLLGAVTHVMTLAQADEVPEAETVAA